MANRKAETRILIVDADGESAQKMGLALDASGLQVAWCSFAPSELSEVLRDLKPTLLLVHAELVSPQVATLLARLESAGMAQVPVALLCRDTSEEVFLRTLRCGVVEMLAEPFNPRLHVARLRVLLGELSERPGKVRGRGGPNELGALVHHLMRTRRTGGVLVGDHEEGSAFFVRGVLKSARYHSQTQQAALAAMTRTQLSWTFVEGLEGTAGVVDFEAAEDRFEAPAPPAQAPAQESESESESEAEPKRRARAAQGSDAGHPPPPAHLPTPAPVVPGTPVGSSAADPDAARTSILFVDDDPAVVQMLSTFFTKRGYTVVTAPDGVEAMKSLASRDFDIVIADLNMPRLDGWGLLRMIREDLRTHEVPVALFSAVDNYRETLRLLHAGAQAYFPKTLRLSALELQLKELLEPRRRFARLIPSEGGLTFDFSSLGPQWTCRALSTAGFRGQLDAADTWAAWRLWFDGGRLTQATARMGKTTIAGDRALAGFLTSRSASGSLLKGTKSPDEGFGGQPTAATLERLVPQLNEEHRRAREDQLARAQALTVHDELYHLYVTVGPPTWLPIARLLCEAKLTPAEVIARLQVTPMEVAAVVKDLLRRGVATLR